MTRVHGNLLNNDKVKLAGIMVFFFLTGCAESDAEKEEPKALSWLSGCWVHEDGATREVWTRSYQGLLFGHSVTQKDEQIRFFEDLRIEPRDEGAVYVASPGGNAPTVFTQTKGGERHVTFENPDHDFPQRIRYQREGERLIATISDMENTKERSFRMRACE